MPNNTLQFQFNRDKAIEAILYLASKTSSPTFFSINKLLYFADKTSLERYGRFISGDTYYALEHGPVPTNSYDIMKEAPPSGEFGFVVENDREIVPKRLPNLDELSESDVECLDAIIELYGRAPVWKLREDSHDEAYDLAWEQRGKSKRSLMTVESIADLLEDSEELVEMLTSQPADRA